MRIRKYTARDLREALQIIKSDLGPEAIIISSRKVRGKGLRAVLGPNLVEVTAAVENHGVVEQHQQIYNQSLPGIFDASGPAVINRTVPGRGTAGEYEYWKKAAKSGFAPTAVNSDQPDPLDYCALERELAQLKRTMGGVQPGPRESACSPGTRTMLRQLGLNDLIIERLTAILRESGPGGTETFKDPAENHEPGLLPGMIRLMEPCYKNVSPGRLMAFIGPTGVGKTTTMAKLAAQFALYRQKRVALLTIDTYRIGAVEQLKTYSEIIGLPLEVVTTPGELKNCIWRHRDKDFILIDTAGRSLKNKEQVFELRKFIEIIPQPRDILLTLSATTKERDLTKIAEVYRKLHFNKIIFTKADETEDLGCLVNIACQAMMPVVYLTDGQKVPDDIHELNPTGAAKLVLGRGGRFAGSGV